MDFASLHRFSPKMEKDDPMIKKPGSPPSTPVVWKVLTIVFLVISIALLIALIVVATKREDSRERKTDSQPIHADVCEDGMSSSDETPKSAGVFDDLSAEELTAVRDYLLKQSSLNITPYDDASLNNNYIYQVQLLPPSKDEALNYLDSDGPKPERKAIAVVFHGATDPPVVEEYVVSPADNPTKHQRRRVPGQRYPIPFNSRPFDSSKEYALLYAMLYLQQVTQKLQKLTKESYDGYTFYPNCADRCLIFTFTAPDVSSTNIRSSWLIFQREVLGKYLHPLDLSLYVDHRGTDTSKWKILKVIYNNQTFDSVDELAGKYENGTIEKIYVPAPEGKQALFSTYERRGNSQPFKPMRGPQQYEPDGKRYTVKGRHISYMSWSFDFRMDSNSGMQIYNIEFGGNRIVYEITLQEAVATYSGYYPFPSWNNNLDASWLMGMSSLELVQGIDCPNGATFFDLVHMAGVSKPLTFHNSVCVFELNTGIPLRRHYDNNFAGGYRFYGGMANQVLVLRSVSTVYNYDYIFDFIFYQNGVIEVKVSASGYVMGAFYNSDSSPYAYPLHESLTSGIHDHLINYKVDLDVGGRQNSYETIDIGIENITERWVPNRRRVQKVLKRSVKKTELEAAYKFNFDHPKYLNFFNEAEKNRMGVKKGYRIQLGSITKQLYPEDWMITPMLSWSLYQMAVTKYKENETQSSSIYNQNAPLDPQVGCLFLSMPVVANVKM